MNFRNIIIGIFCLITSALSAADRPALVYVPGFREMRHPTHTFHQYSILQNKYPSVCNNKHVYQVLFSELHNDIGKPDHDSGLYTAHTIHHAARTFNDWINNQQIVNSPVIEGVIAFSNGAGVLINFLAQLAAYDQDYWMQSHAPHSVPNLTSPVPVITEDEAKAIMQKINSGSIVLDAPLVHLRNFKRISPLSNRISAGVSTLGVMLAALCCMPFSWMLLAGSAAVGAVIGLIFKTPLKRFFGNIIVRNYVHKENQTMHFDPNHLSPLESVQQLRGTITCPVLIHFHEQDGTLDGPGADAALFCGAFDEDKTVICVTCDGNHGTPSKKFEEILNQFLEKIKQNDVNWPAWISVEQDTNPGCLYRPSEFKAKYGSIFDR